ncbi:hypothetical protein ROTAS13_03456 [Roseomonas sp. TAS13]|nr:hypothetical protein ROTAS13_03456 [Roseomonas sp. TAS13]
MLEPLLEPEPLTTMALATAPAEVLLDWVWAEAGRAAKASPTASMPAPRRRATGTPRSAGCFATRLTERTRRARSPGR